MSPHQDTNEQKIALAEIKAALNTLYDVCERNHAALCGYAFSDNPPLFVRFGNVTETGPDFTVLLLKLDEFINESVNSSDIRHIRFGD